jgi:hypothetical protein
MIYVDSYAVRCDNRRADIEEITCWSFAEAEKVLDEQCKRYPKHCFEVIAIVTGDYEISMGNYKPVDKLSQLPRGTIVRHRSSEQTYVVTANYGDRVTAVANVDITNPSEWLWFDDSSANQLP